MKITSTKISISTHGNSEIVDITNRVQNELKKSGLIDGIVTVFVPGSTAGVTTMEYEPGLIKDTTDFFNELISESKKYSHDASHAKSNASSHLRATVLGPSLTIPFEESHLTLGTWQQIVFIDFDYRPRNREIILKFMGRGQHE